MVEKRGNFQGWNLQVEFEMKILDLCCDDDCVIGAKVNVVVIL